MRWAFIAVLMCIVGAMAAAPGSEEADRSHRQSSARANSLPSLDARGVTGIREISRPELEKLMSKSRGLSLEEKAELDRGCPGLVCLYQSLGVKRWPESAVHTVAYLELADALQRRCPSGQENFLFVKQGWWLGGRRPSGPRATPVSAESVTRVRPGGFTFNRRGLLSRYVHVRVDKSPGIRIPAQPFPTAKGISVVFPTPSRGDAHGPNFLFDVPVVRALVPKGRRNKSPG